MSKKTSSLRFFVTPGRKSSSRNELLLSNAWPLVSCPIWVCSISLLYWLVQTWANKMLAATDTIASNFVEFLNDYTTDRRGDIGSLIRVEAIQAVGVLLQRQSDAASRSPLIQNLVGCLCRLACEKLDKVRLQAWLSLQDFWESAADLPPLEK